MLLAITLIILLACVAFGVKRTMSVIKNTSQEVVEVIKSAGPKKDPIGRLKEQIKAYKVKLTELVANTESLKKARSKQEDVEARALAVATVAKEKGARADSLEAFRMSKAAGESIASLEADIEANEELYETMKNSLSGRQMQLNKFEASAKRREMRSAANSIRRDIAKDELLEEGLFAADLDDDTCQEEIEAVAIEKVNSDLKGGDVLERYDAGSPTDEEFDKFFGEKSE